MIENNEPCVQCPFRRGVDPGICASKNTVPEAFIGQAIGNFLLPCHLQAGFKESPYSPELRQCPGAAKYRANCGYEVHSRLLQLPADPVTVFSSPAELLAHHWQVSIEYAESVLRNYTPEQMLEVEQMRAGVRVVNLGGKPKEELAESTV